MSFLVLPGSFHVFSRQFRNSWTTSNGETRCSGTSGRTRSLRITPLFNVGSCHMCSACVLLRNIYATLRMRRNPRANNARRHSPRQRLPENSPAGGPHEGEYESSSCWRSHVVGFESRNGRFLLSIYWLKTQLSCLSLNKTNKTTKTAISAFSVAQQGRKIY